MRTLSRMIFAAVLLGAATGASATVVDASSTTMVTAGQQTAGGLAGQRPDLLTAVPAFEIINVSARDIQAPGFDDLQIVLSSWGSYDFATVRTDAGVGTQLTGDVQTGYVKGQLFDRHLTLQVGREFIAAGAGQMIQIDGGSALLQLPGGISLSGYAGSPVSQRFATRGGYQDWNPLGGDLAYGGRLGWNLPLDGGYGRGLDLGVSSLDVEDRGQSVRQDAGVDLRYQPSAGFTVTGNGVWDMYAARVAEADVTALWNVTRLLYVTADVQFTTPDSFLSNNSILSVFADSAFTQLGGGVTYRLTPALSIGGDYHAVLEPGPQGTGTSLGHEVLARLEYQRSSWTAGTDVSYIDTYQDGYTSLRVYGRRDFGPAFVSVDAMGTHLQTGVNGLNDTVNGILSAGYTLGGGWSAVVSGTAGVNPFMEQQYDLMAKLVYNQTYRAREVK